MRFGNKAWIAITGASALFAIAPSAFAQTTFSASSASQLALFFSLGAPEGGSPAAFLALGGLACAGAVVLAVRHRTKRQPAPEN
jgi:hypothetical protein